MIKNFMSSDAQNAIQSILDIVANADEYKLRIQEIVDEQEKLQKLLKNAGGITAVKNREVELEMIRKELLAQEDGIADIRHEAEQVLAQARSTAESITGTAMLSMREEKERLDMKSKELDMFAKALSQRELTVMAQEQSNGNKQKNVDAEMDRLQQLRESNEALRQEYMAKKAKVDEVLGKL